MKNVPTTFEDLTHDGHGSMITLINKLGRGVRKMMVQTVPQSKELVQSFSIDSQVTQGFKNVEYVI